MGIYSRYVIFLNVTFIITKLFYYSLITNFRDNDWSDDDGDDNFDERHDELSHTEITDRRNCYKLARSIFTIDWANPTNILFHFGI
jgi:hypothetical protein